MKITLLCYRHRNDNNQKTILNFIHLKDFRNGLINRSGFKSFLFRKDVKNEREKLRKIA